MFKSPHDHAGNMTSGVECLSSTDGPVGVQQYNKIGWEPLHHIVRK